ncbi:MAG: hypothetical protein H0U73_11230 [Tatlockia sp.]|nr:hypothetical protein [Tatlockia sp.]
MKGFRVSLASLMMLLFVQASFALPGTFFEVAASGLNLIIKTQVPTHPLPYVAAGIRVLSPDYSLSPTANCKLNFLTGYCVFTVGNSLPAAITLIGSSGTVDLQLCLNANSPYTCQNYTVLIGGGIIPTPPIKTQAFAYVVSFGTNQVFKCNIAANGSLFNCIPTVTSGLSSPIDVAIDPTNRFAYITTSINTVLKCNLFPTDGNLINCAPTGSGFVAPAGITTHTIGNTTYAYVVNGGLVPTVSKCTIAPNGDLMSCALSVIGAVNGYRGIAINPTGTLAYIANNSTNEITRCIIAINGDLSGCVLATNSIVGGPSFLDFNNAGTIAYVTTVTLVYKCDVDGVGNLTSCVTTGSGFTNPGGIALNFTGTLVYVVNGGVGANNVSVCSIDSNNELANCTTSGSVPTPFGIALSGPIPI